MGGKALATKYEFEDGHWQYAVTVQDKKGQLYEAEVSATTGRVTANEKTTPAEEAQEAAADKKAAAAHSHHKQGWVQVGRGQSATCPTTHRAGIVALCKGQEDHGL